jgi:murein DD-endopeptidase MepM/ murein hydrolase activator NlpD
LYNLEGAISGCTEIMIFKQKLLVVTAIIISFLCYSSVRAQGEEPTGAYYIVQEGDSVWQIAARFGVAVEDLMKENNISDANQLTIGMRLIIPGLQGVEGQLTTITVAYGDTLRSLSRYYGVSPEILARLNGVISPAELYAGYSLIVPVKENQDAFRAGRANLGSGQSLLELAVLRGEDTWSLTLANNLPGEWAALPGEILGVVGDDSQPRGPLGLPAAVTQIEVEPLVMLQGGTTVIKLIAPSGISISGSLSDHVLNFFPESYGYVAIQGVHTMTPASVYPLTLQGELSNGEQFAFRQNVLIRDANFPYDPSLTVDPITVDPAVTGPENELWASLGALVTPEKMWNGLFASPVPPQFTNCRPSLFGTRRSYNGSPYDYFHGGLDFCGTIGTELYASATGRVVYTGLLTVRGNVVVVDHGWGVYTAYDHLSEILVQVNDIVQPGQLIGLGGATGRATGPHLHWEVWAGGVQVNPAEWLEKAYP